MGRVKKQVQRSPLATKLVHIVLFHDDITQRDLKKSTTWYTCESYTEFQHCRCITFEDMNIFLRAILIFHGLILLLVQRTSENHRYLAIIIIILIIGLLYSKRPGLTQCFNAKIGFEKYSLSPEILAKMYLGCSKLSVPSNKI